MSAVARVEPFRPVGERSKWKAVFDLFTGQEPGVTVTYEEIAAVLPRFDRDRDRWAITRAGDVLLREEQRALVCVPNVGYRVAPAVEHVDLATSRSRRARRQARRGAVVSRNFRRDEVDADTAARLDRMSLRLDRLEHVIASVARRQSQLDVQLAEARVQADRDADVTRRQLAALRAALVKHGIPVDGD